MVDLQFITITELVKFKKRVALAGIIICLISISWLGILDLFSYDYLNGSLMSALSSYTVSRTLNGIISVLQSSSLSVGIASVTVGELLDPVNDIVEKFSELLMLSISSIIIQKVLLSIVSSVFFKGLLTFSGLVMLASLAAKKSSYIPLMYFSYYYKNMSLGNNQVKNTRIVNLVKNFQRV